MDESPKVCKQFVDFMIKKGYDKNRIYISNYRNPMERKSKWYKRIEIRIKGKIVQAFVLMPETDRDGMIIKKYPFYRSYKQMATKSDNVYPACYVATYDESKHIIKKWDIYSCNCLDYKLDKDITNTVINYNEAEKSFFKRWKSVPSIRMAKWLRIVSLVIAGMGVLSMLFYKRIGLSPENLCSIGIFVSVFVVLAIIAPCINTFTIFGTGFQLVEDEGNKEK